MKKALVIIDIQNDITKNYKDVIGNINKAIDWAVNNDVCVVYIYDTKIYQTAQGLLNPIHVGLN